MFFVNSKAAPLGLSICALTLGGCFVTFSVFGICLKFDERPKKLSQGCFVQRCVLPCCADFGAYFRRELYESVSRWLVRWAVFLGGRIWLWFTREGCILPCLVCVAKMLSVVTLHSTLFKKWMWWTVEFLSDGATVLHLKSYQGAITRLPDVSGGVVYTTVLLVNLWRKCHWSKRWNFCSFYSR